jgi:DNA-binding Lrp family transcriptional regulator
MKYLQSVKETNKVSLDLKDKKILNFLSLNSRLPLTKLAKGVGLSRDAIKYRINNYEKTGLIQGYRALVDISKFGYNNYHLFIKLNNPSNEIEKKIITRLSSLNFIRAIIKFGGSFDFEIALIAKDIADLDSKITEIIGFFENTIQEIETLILSKVYVSETFPHNFLAQENPKQREELKKDNKNNQINIDKKDLQILNIISEKANMRIIDIAKETKLSADSITYRIKNMLVSGIIKKFIPIINYSSLDYSLYAVLLDVNSFDEKKDKAMKEFLLNNQNTLWAVKTIGRYNVLIYFLVKNTEELQETVSCIRSLFPKEIRDYQILIGYEEYKYVYLPKNLI